MSRAPSRRRVSGFLPAAVLLLLVVVLAGAPLAGAPAAAAVFLLAAPAPAVALALDRLDPVSRAVAGLGAVFAVDTVVAEVMVATRLWSPRGGGIAVGALSVVIALVLARRPPVPAPAARGPAPAADLREERPT